MITTNVYMITTNVYMITTNVYMITMNVRAYRKSNQPFIYCHWNVVIVWDFHSVHDFASRVDAESDGLSAAIENVMCSRKTETE